MKRKRLQKTATCIEPKIDLGKSLALFLNTDKPENFQRQATALALVLNGVTTALWELDTVNYMKFINRLDPSLRTAHEMMSGLMRMKDDNGLPCSAQSAMKAALKYYNPAKDGDITMKLYEPLVVKHPFTIRRWIRQRLYKQPRAIFWSWIYKQIFSKP